MIELLFLGTAASVPSRMRGLPALLVQCRKTRVLIDCGEGTQRQLLLSGAGFKDLRRILLTHGHPDHLLGLGGLVSTLALWRAAQEVEIYAGKQPLSLAKRLLEEIVWPDAALPLTVRFHELQPGQLVSAGDLKIHAFPVRHRGPDSFGFIIDEHTHWHLDGSKLDDLGVPAGAQRKQLAQGNAIVLDDGRRIVPADVSHEHRGARVVVVGDCESTEDLVPYASAANALVIESTFLACDADKAQARSHLTAAQAAHLAAEAGVGQLLLTHVSARYHPDEIQAEAQAIFPAVQVVDDFSRWQIQGRHSTETKTL